MEELLTLSLSIIYTTVADKTQASIIVKQLVNSNMILCGNIISTEIRTRIKGYPGKIAHRRHIAQWSGRRMLHPRGTGFETGPAPKLASARRHSAGFCVYLWP